MRFSTALFVALSLLVSQVAATPGLDLRQNDAAAAKQKGGNGGKNGGNNGGKGGNNGNNGGNNGGGKGGDIQSSLTLDPSVIADGFANDGQDVPVQGQVASLTSTNNFINFCATVNLPITNGLQIKSGSCNPAPMGSIPSTDNMPSSKFVFPKNLDNIEADTAFTIQMAIRGMETGFFTNANKNYFSAPQQLNNGGQITGHSHVVIEQLDSIDQTKPSNPNVFAFFKGLNGKAKNGVLTAAVDKGLPAGTYKLSSINTAGNHQPCLVPIAQHGSLDDAVYFTVGGAAKDAASQVAGAGAGGNNKGNNKGNAQGGADATGNADANGNANAVGNADPNGKTNDNGKGNAKGGKGNTKGNADATGAAGANDNADVAGNADNNAPANDNGKATPNDNTGGNKNADNNAAGAGNTGGKNNTDNKGGAGGKARRFARVHRRFAHDSY